jgi:hypothetical protein
MEAMLPVRRSQWAVRMIGAQIEFNANAGMKPGGSGG